MLTADLARARRFRGELRLIRMDDRARGRARELASYYLALARDHLGHTRGELDQAFDQVLVRPSELKLANGIRKLVDDRCRFDVACKTDPRILRSEIFLLASDAVRNLPEGERFDRDGFVAEQALARAMAPETLEKALYSDLRSEQVLVDLENISPERLVQGYEEAQAQAVLLRAVRVTAEVRCADAYRYRTLFQKLKFQRLLYAIAALADGGYRIDIDGPYSLFSSVTRYGLQLALAFPAIKACDDWKLLADVRWGKNREPLLFRLQGHASERGLEEEPRLPDEVQTLLERLQKADTPWQVQAAAEILELPGFGLCVPDLRFEHANTGEVAFLEVMGFWSRDAVWRRVELVQKGLPDRIVFAVGSRLRVSEAVLDDELPSQLYVYKGTMSAREILKRLDRKKR